MDGSPAVFWMLNFIIWAIGLYVLYWVIRLAVRHALRDVGSPVVATKQSKPKSPQV